MSIKTPDFDVAIIGSGLAGTSLAACLARNGARVVIVDAGSHPRFAIGESTIPATSMMMRLVSERYGVPELKWLATFEGVQSKITTTCGVKRNFGFLYHRPGEPQNPRETHMFPIPKVTHTENHYFRQDIDAWMLQVAAKYGATVYQNVPIVDIDVDNDGVTVKGRNDERFRAKFVVDASGYRSVLAEKYSLREQPTRFRHHSRSLFTHMIGVTPYDKIAPKKVYGHPSPWHEGTQHHLFKGGWMWIIGFDNHLRGTNPLCSVGLQLDPRIHPQPDCSPEEEFRRFIARYPGIEVQFRNATAVREWTRTGRLQYSSRQTVGFRWNLTSHAAGFLDPLFSRGLINSLETMHALVHRILAAIKDGDWSVERFQYMQEFEQGLLDFNDDLVSNAYTSFGHWPLWDVWFRIWSYAQFIGTFEINRGYARYLDTRDISVLAPLERPWWRGKLVPEASPYRPVLELLREANERTQAVQEGLADADTTARELMKMMMEADFVPPAWGLADPGSQWTDASFWEIAKTLRWAKRTAPKAVGELTYDGLLLFMKKRFSPGEFAVGEELKHALARWPVIGSRFRVPAPK